MFTYNKKQWVRAIFGLLLSGLIMNPLLVNATSSVGIVGSQGLSPIEREALIVALVKQVQILQAKLLELQKTTPNNNAVYETVQLDTYRKLLLPLRELAEIEYDKLRGRNNNRGGYNNTCTSTDVKAAQNLIVSKNGLFHCFGKDDKYVITGSLKTNATQMYCIDSTGFSGVIPASERIPVIGRAACNLDPNAAVHDPSGVTSSDYTTGATDARIEIVTYTDFDCPFCKQFHDTIGTIIKEYKDVSVSYRHFPIETAFPNAKKLAITAECVGMLEGDEAFWKFADRLFASREVNETTDMEEVDSLAAKIGVSRSQIAKCQLSDVAREAVETDMGEGLYSGITGAPMSFIYLDGQVGRLDGAQPLHIVRQILDKLTE